MGNLAPGENPRPFRPSQSFDHRIHCRAERGSAIQMREQIAQRRRTRSRSEMKESAGTAWRAWLPCPIGTMRGRHEIHSGSAAIGGGPDRATGLENSWSRDLFEGAPIPMHWVGPDGLILWANRAELELLGYEHDEYVGKPIAEFHVDPEEAHKLLQRLWRKEELRGHEARMRSKDGSIKHVLVSSNVVWHGERRARARIA
jgi:PAS domain S-box-containing protein